MSPTTVEKLEVRLPHPEGASPGLNAIIDAVEEYIQRSILLLASGTPGDQLDFVAWLDGKGLLSEKGLDEPDGESVLVDDYSDRRQEVKDRTAELERQNRDVDDSQVSAFHTSNQTYQNIVAIVEDLQDALNGAHPTTKGEDGVYRLSAATEAGLLRSLLIAVGRVYDEVEKAAIEIENRARDVDRAVPQVPERYRTGGGVPLSPVYRPTPSTASYRITDPNDPTGTILSAARGELGVAESGTNYVAGKPYNINGPWCAAFTSWLWKEAGYDVDWTNPNYVPAIWNDAHAMKLQATAAEAEPGDLIVFDWEGDGTPDHIGIVERKDGETIYTIEGNSSDRVARREYEAGSGNIVGFVKQPPTGPVSR
ncbi:C40 family peptidase [Nocardia grenadensis]|uniref:C40 family peptidase n=1 Tax=Nocardia grenadensis TaxID=931537 RepID=UPI0007A43C17|nr:CHAP domain-containing protein [Nocardia grenadensis]